MRKLGFVAAALILSLPASAEIVTFDYTGVISNISENSVATGVGRIVASSNALPGGVRVGQTFFGQFSYDTAIAGSPGTPVSRWYAGSANVWQPASTITLNHSGFTVAGAASQSSVLLRNDSNGRDNLILYATYPDGPLQFGFYDGTGTAFSSLSLPLDLNVDAFDKSQAYFTWSNTPLGTNVFAGGLLTSITRITPVPEPDSWAMLLAGVAIVGAGALRRRVRATTT